MKHHDMMDDEAILEGYWGLTPLEMGSESPMAGDEDGRVRFGNVRLTNLPINIYNKAAFNFREQLREELGVDVAGNLLKNAGHECGYNTLTAVYLSDPFQDAIAPMCEDKHSEAWALTLGMRAFGMIRARLLRADEEEYRARSYSCPEATYYLDTHDEHSEKPVCDMQVGIMTGLQNLVYRGDSVNDRDKVYQDEPDVLHPDAYFGREVKCRAKGDPYCEFVIRKEFNLNNDLEVPEEFE